MTNRALRIGTRGSPLALAQTALVREALVAAEPGLGAAGALDVQLIRTTGDIAGDRPLAEIGGKGLFTKEIDEALAAGRIDLAVHSMKDVPTWLPGGQVIGAYLAREDPRDAWIAREGLGLGDLAAGSVVGTSSLRRAAQVRYRRPDLRVVPFSGNVGTRLDKLARGEADATLLALAGLRRLGREDVATAILDAEEMLPAIAQGAIGIACRADDARTRALLACIDHPATARAIAAERALLAGLDGSCRTPIAGLAEPAPGGRLVLRGLLAKPDGSAVVADRAEAPATDAEALGAALAERLLARAGAGFLAAE
ncbi:MAG TPA: hydroxymethylbilane synthase [Alphaproteobacteria bacterium]